MPQSPIVPSQINPLTFWADSSGKPYLVKRQPSGEVTLTPLESALSQLQPQTQTPTTTRQQDPLALLGLAIAVALGIALSSFCLGFLAGQQGQNTVIVPRSPICRTAESSFLFWSSRQEDCK